MTPILRTHRSLPAVIPLISTLSALRSSSINLCPPLVILSSTFMSPTAVFYYTCLKKGVYPSAPAVSWVCYILALITSPRLSVFPLAWRLRTLSIPHVCPNHKVHTKRCVYLIRLSVGFVKTSMLVWSSEIHFEACLEFVSAHMAYYWPQWIDSWYSTVNGPVRLHSLRPLCLT